MKLNCEQAIYAALGISAAYTIGMHWLVHFGHNRYFIVETAQFFFMAIPFVSVMLLLEKWASTKIFSARIPKQIKHRRTK